MTSQETATPTILKLHSNMRMKKMRHIYILSCETDGGIYHYFFEKGKLQFVEKTTLDRPMYAIIRENELYVVLREIDKITRFGGLLSFDIDENGNLINPTEIESTNGIVPCHLEVTDKGKYIVNYLSGNIVKMGEKIVTHKGNGIHPTRQEAPHTHFVTSSPDKKYILCSDLGLDKIFVYTMNLEKVSEVDAPKGHGPRHLIFSGDGKMCFVANELESTVTAFQYNDGKLDAVNTVSCIPDDGIVDSTASAIRFSDGFVYVSNRGHNSIAVMQFINNKLRFINTIDCFGNFPRDFQILGDYIISTNEKSDDISVIDKNSLKLIDMVKNIPAPVCVVYDEMQK